jgi:multidrug resistance efflux pump
MLSHDSLDLADHTEYRQALQANPPKAVHLFVILLVVFLSAALLWICVTQADLVVRAPGRVRPVSDSQKVFVPAYGDPVVSTGGRTVSVNFREGDAVSRGDILIRVDADRIESEIRRTTQTIRTVEDELIVLARLELSASQQFEETAAKADAELRQSTVEVSQAEQRRVVDARLAQVTVDSAAGENGRTRELVEYGIAPAAELVKSTARLREAEERLAAAMLPIGASRVEVSRRALALTRKDYAVKAAELALKRRNTEAAIAAARLQLSNLEIQRERTVIRAPVAGIVTAGNVRVGDILEPGKPVLEIAEQRGFRFEIAIRTDDVAPLRVGMPARINLDAYDHHRYGALNGKVSFIAPDSGIHDGSGERVTATYLVRIDILQEELRRGDLRGPIRLGMTGYTEIVTARESLLSLLMTQFRQRISFG